MNTATATATTTSLFFIPKTRSNSVPPFSSSSSCFFAGGSRFKKFPPDSLSSASQFNKKICARRFGSVVVAAADYYSTLGVPKSADSKEIKSAYRRLARQVLNPAWHFGFLFYFSNFFELWHFTLSAFK
ncbi:Molecular chaperone (superfamily) [Olea europaea subsp. europaea]|uniref:Molecular chaperone (Superfamily) n=1 Tax=Olea europaea subsp. europaea TaxID=158383 RepID=A0A8S0UVH1_OLEEU|nr:Molecular chaperone (superfamily) [Olea europaea subsp. europaea]